VGTKLKPLNLGELSGNNWTLKEITRMFRPYLRDALTIAPALLGETVARKFGTTSAECL
jgi:hypothetical protein